MTDPADSGGRVDREQQGDREVTEMGWAWWLGLLLVPLTLGLVGRDATGGFPSVFLWAVVAFVVGSWGAFALAAHIGGREPVRRLTPQRPHRPAGPGSGAHP
ncbi:hypothetical protein [Intrasporangium sp. DVR]|uniref:hypothetical protein n=1 Tax=Intrasporangium sp. DVR TaxID=3127867 RepID=UPI00313A69FF